MTVVAPLRIIFVDDDVEYTLLLKLVLERLGHVVTTFHDPHKAVAALAPVPCPFDLLISDQRMPAMEGLEVVSRARAAQPRLRCVIVSSDVTAVDPDRAARAGVAVVAAKPDRIEGFAALVARVTGPGLS